MPFRPGEPGVWCVMPFNAITVSKSMIDTRTATASAARLCKHRQPPPTLRWTRMTRKTHKRNTSSRAQHTLSVQGCNWPLSGTTVSTNHNCYFCTLYYIDRRKPFYFVHVPCPVQIIVRCVRIVIAISSYEYSSAFRWKRKFTWKLSWMWGRSTFVMMQQYSIAAALRLRRTDECIYNIDGARKRNENEIAIPEIACHGMACGKRWW